MGKGIDADAVVGGATDMGSSTFVMVLRWAPELSIRKSTIMVDTNWFTFGGSTLNVTVLG